MTERSFEKSQALYARALETVPLASQTFSKSAMQYVGGAAPLFLDRGDGCRVTDVDGNEYIDYVLGLLPVVLGYRDPDVDRAIRAQLDKGISFSLATDLEAELAERLVRMIPCAEMVRFGKNGSDATSAAIRLARAFTGRDRIALAGYHGWHDWYIGTTARHFGVPQAVRDLSSPFTFNDVESLEKLLNAAPGEYAAVILEPSGLDAPAPGFLEDVRALCDRHGAILVFDEIVTGFRIGMGGAQETYGVTPDLAAFGKAMGNGMPISAIVGRRDIMTVMDKIFFSGTFGGEALSLAASIATLDKLEREQVPARIAATGARLREGAAGILKSHEIDAEYVTKGPDWWPAVLPTGEGRADRIVTLSLLRQELVAEGLLFMATFNLSLAHDDPQVIDETLAAFDGAMGRVAEALRSNDPAARLKGAPVEPVFQVRQNTGPTLKPKDAAE